MYANAVELINKEITSTILNHLYSVIYLASDTHSLLIKEPIFQTEIAQPLRSRLMRLCIWNQFENGFVPKNIELEPVVRPVNNFKETTIDLVGKNILLNFRKAYCTDSLYSNAPMYCKKAAENNVFSEAQFVFDFDRFPSIEEEVTYFLILFYTMKNDKIDQLFLTVPSTNMSTSLYFKSLSKEYETFCRMKYYDVSEKESHEEQVAKLKEYTLNKHGRVV